MVTCLICKKEFKNGGVLARHLIVNHQMTYREYYHKNILCNDEIPKCKCGCGAEMTWTTMGYREFAKGHYSRVHNNWGHNPKAIEASAKTRRQQYALGERKMWNDGLTKEINESVKLNGELRAKAYTSEIKKEYAERMSKNRLNGTIPNLKGSQHSQWKGGVSEINILARTNKRLYDEWKYPILVRDGFKCVECGKADSKLHIHHNKELMCEIVQKHMPDEEDIVDFELKKSIADKIVDYHIQNKVSGITLCEVCHNKLHPSLNFS